jgi:hypothetical protein
MKIILKKSEYLRVTFLNQAQKKITQWPGVTQPPG